MQDSTGNTIPSVAAHERSTSRSQASNMTELHPSLTAQQLAWYTSHLDALPDDTPRFERMLGYLGRVIDLTPPKDLVVIGCGPRPRLVKMLRERGYSAVGIEPQPTFVTAAQEYLQSSREVLQGSAEAIPLKDAACDVVFCESVLEHVDSPRVALDEMYRVLKPGGIAFITTTNRLRFSFRGFTDEFNVPFFNWFPSLVRESYVFRHLHFDPSLANFTLRPAVHWFTFAELCRLGRYSGFARFYSPLDLLRTSDPIIRSRWWRRLLLKPIQRSAWLRALALTQVGHGVVMLKRAQP